jgi:ABC-type transport system involved in multi-copper enzyme maturation permease subunit
VRYECYGQTQVTSFLSCLVLSCLVLSCLVLSCLVLPCLALSCLVLSCLVCTRASFLCTFIFTQSLSSTPSSSSHSYSLCSPSPRIHPASNLHYSTPYLNVSYSVPPILSSPLLFNAQLPYFQPFISSNMKPLPCDCYAYTHVYTYTYIQG